MNSNYKIARGAAFMGDPSTTKLKHEAIRLLGARELQIEEKMYVKMVIANEKQNR